MWGLNMNKMLKVILPIILILGLSITGCAAESESAEAKVGQPAPNFQLKNLDGESVSLKDLKGKPVLLNFWSTRCNPCVREMPFLQEIYDEWSSKGLILLAINIGDGPSAIKGFLQDHNLALPVLLDIEGTLAQRYNIIGIPTTFFIDTDGVIQEKIIGAFPNKAEIEKRLPKIVQ
jgi:peroxiredoxin